ncbi:partitioning defective 3 homolog B isoform X1 [Diabrotica virgifera virgifera]|uniref:Partitioning defective 3 homolog B isoform X1 n=1 Tax=Diabrotica virgifera virgifera TaxID=50390 RepID=A0A6P7G5F8_DIAVI|nr:partitioning defective 3 homolog B isoform X1 [Diabrotica virgifera virgifera]XP_028144231.1 partitioning defective 3 homolog B isoform X1 [Diabrotica virgifera virgifera]XP_028144239.1 partitioning defective 3 homolog B isoform X1 [Diabrotica virgifera virgifera]
MFDTCQTINAGPKCTEVAEKLVSLFGWRQTYNVEKLQRNVPGRATTRISITRPSSLKEKSIKQGSDSWVSVHNLQSQGGGILDPDDKLNDVADDREQILASFEDGEGAHIHGGGDGASGSSVGTGSPDIFHDGEHKYGPNYPRTDIEVTGEQIASGVPILQVRRGSEPSLNQLPTGPPAPSDHPKRWSAAPLILEPPSSGYASPDWMDDSREEEGDHSFRRIARDGSNRLSMQFLGVDGAGYRWAEAAERAAASRPHISSSLPRESRRKEPLGQANNSTTIDGEEIIVIRNEPGPLGIHVIPDYDTLGRERGLLVKGIEPGGRIDRDGRLAIYDRVVEINGENLINMPFQRVQELFKLSLTSPELRLKVIKTSGLEGLRKPPPPIYPSYPDDKENVSMVECEQKRHLTESTNTKVATVSPTKKVPAISKNLKGLLTANTRKIGRKIEIELIKGNHGLGFSITTRDNPAGGKCPIYIKNINAMGPAIEDGRLKIGDRLLEVNNIEMTGKTQSEAVALLKSLPLSSKVKIVVSRQEDVVDTTLPRIIDVDLKEVREEEAPEDIPPTIPPLPQSHLQALQNRTPEKGSVAKIISQFQDAVNGNPSDQIDETMVFPWKHREILTFNIPVHDSEKAGLGVSVKGKTSGTKDLGIFIKGVMCGGAASRDNRLRTNDQLLNVNGISLLQQTNSDAMETLKNAIPHTEGPVPGHITLTIARRVESPNNSSRKNSLDSILGNSTGDSQEKSESVNNSGNSGDSANTVIFNPHGGIGNISDNKAQVNTQLNGQLSNQLSPMHTWNPVLERLTGNGKFQQQQLRNESYYKATHDTWTSSMLGNNSFGNMSGTTVNIATAEPILIEDEYGSRVLTHSNQHQQQINVHMTNKVPTNISDIRTEHEPDGKDNKTSSSGSNGDKSTDTSSQTTIQCTDATYASQLSLENPKGFSRDAFGRQSMSEKRHATLDAKNTDTYQKSKKIREERKMKEITGLVRVGSVESVISVNRSAEHPEYADKLGQLGPSLGMKKSSSLESLQTMVQEIQMQEEGDPAYSYRGPNGALKVIRGKGCEESFRAAVVDPNHRSEIGAKKHWLLDGPMENEREVDGFSNARGGPRQSSLNAAIDIKNKSAKKKPGIFKGIGSMFRFGKHRKLDFQTAEAAQHYHHTNEFDSNANVPQQHTADTENRTQSSQPERTQEHSQKVPQNSNPQNQNTSQGSHHQSQGSQNSHHSQSSHNSSQSSHQSQSAHYPNSHAQSSHQSSTTHHPSQNVPHQSQSSHVGSQTQGSHSQSRSSPTTNQNLHHSQQSSSHGHREQQHIIREPLYQRHGYLHRHAEQVQVIPENAVAPPVKYRQNSSEHRRHDREAHKQRMTQRHTYYQSDERDVYDLRHQQPQRIDPSNAYVEYGRPGSRSGITDSVPFTHYVNYKELQNHISRNKDTLSDSQIVQMRLQVQQQRLKVEEESRKQHQYHSQRQTRSDNQLRPVSNYYEYESIQSILNGGRSRQNAPQTTSQQPSHYQQDVNSNSLPRNQPVQSRHTSGRGRGPFVTQVTIGEHHQSGTKV